MNKEKKRFFFGDLLLNNLNSLIVGVFVAVDDLGVVNQ